MSSSPQQYSALDRLRADISHVLDPAYERERVFRNFLKDLHFGAVSLNDFEVAVRRVSTGSAFAEGNLLPGTAELYATLPDSEKLQLREHYFRKLDAISQEFPGLKGEFPEQFR